ncbi:MAG: cytochrome c3 family protein [Nitrospirae bacterium]|nr:cytochrome c3 family protein [Nitrospirota bacterium]
MHNRLSCSDCHFGFSSEEHPVRRFKTKRDYSVATSEICRRCHFDKYTRTLEGIHYNLLTQGNLKAPVCTDCHGAHSVYSGRKEKLANAKKCEQCHSEIYNIYSKSVHGGALISEHNEDVPVCSDCHSAHDITDPRTLDFRNTVPQICGNCHANKAIVGKYGLSTDVVRTYLSDFHGVTLGFYKKQRETLTKPTRSIAVCTDCHGTHNISSMRGVSLSVIKANMAKRCEQCHKDATGNFPDAWLSHYEPSLKKASIVFIINRAYEVLMPIMLIGLLLQILLHVWRYAINR